jgi:hypothetical protein
LFAHSDNPRAGAAAFALTGMAMMEVLFYRLSGITATSIIITFFLRRFGFSFSSSCIFIGIIIFYFFFQHEPDF